MNLYYGRVLINFSSTQSPSTFISNELKISKETGKTYFLEPDQVIGKRDAPKYVRKDRLEKLEGAGNPNTVNLPAVLNLRMYSVQPVTVKRIYAEAAEYLEGLEKTYQTRTNGIETVCSIKDRVLE